MCVCVCVYKHVCVCVCVCAQKYRHTFILSFRKNKYQIYSYITFNIDDSKRSIHMKTYLLRISQ